MTMRVLYGAGPADIRGYDTTKLRENFLIEDLFADGEVRFVYTHVDRLILGGGVPTRTALTFGSGTDVGTQYLLSAREMGIANLGGAGSVTIDGQTFKVANREIVYAGRGAREITLASDDAAKPARFYMNSVPAGADIPHRLITRSEAKAHRDRHAGEGQQAPAGHVYPSRGRSLLPAVDGHHRSRSGQHLEHHAAACA